MLKRSGDLEAIPTKFETNDGLFIDEIHQTSPVEKVLYPAMENHQTDITIGKGASAPPLEIAPPPFTPVGEATRACPSTAP